MTDPVSLTIFTDGGSRGNPGAAAVGFHVVDSSKNTIYELGVTIGHRTNNEAEYAAIIASLKWLLTHQPAVPIQHVQWFLDSMLVVEQLNGRWKLKQVTLKPLFDEAQTLLHQITFPYKITHIPRELNRRADALVNEALDSVDTEVEPLY